MPDYFFDTSVLVGYLMSEDPISVALVKSVLDGRFTASISAITVAEICAHHDMRNRRKRRERLALLALMQVVPVDSTVAQKGGELRLRYRLEIPDAIVAASGKQAGGRFHAKDPHFERLFSAGVLKGQIIQ